MPVTIDQIRNVIRRKDDVTPEDMLALANLIEGGVATHAGAGAYTRGSDITTFNGLSSAIAFAEVEDYDDLGFFEIGSPDRFTVPTVTPAIERMQMSVMVEWAADADGDRNISLVTTAISGARDAVGWWEMAMNAPAAGTAQMWGITPPFPVSAGDAIQVQHQQSSGGNLDIIDIHVAVWVVK